MSKTDSLGTLALADLAEVAGGTKRKPRKPPARPPIQLPPGRIPRPWRPPVRPGLPPRGLQPL